MSRARYFEVATDQLGRPIPGVTVTVYQAGTTTPIVATIYSAATGGGTLTNPLTANGQGEIEFFLAVSARVDLAWSKNLFASETHPVDVIAADAFVFATDKGAANGVATLDSGGLVPTTQMPPLAISDTFVVASQAAMLALTAQRGDVAIRSDLSQTFILAAEPASSLGNWLQLATPVDAVASVDGLTGTVTLPGDGVAGTATKRTLGTGATQAASGAALAAEITNRTNAISALNGTYIARSAGTAGTVATLPVVNVKDYGAVGDGSTDDTTAIQAAITAMAATNYRTLYFPQGRYKVTSTLQISVKGFRFLGDREGRIDVYGGSQIECNFVGTLIQLGTDNGHAYDASDYDGLAEGFTAEHIGFKATATTTALDNGQNVYCANTYAIRDWRGGSVNLDNVWFLFFDFSFWGIQSDFNTFNNVNQWYCHSGMYVGPRSDQFTLNRFLGKSCDRVLDIDGAWHVRINNSECVDSGATATNPVRVRSAWTRGSQGIVFDKYWLECVGASVVQNIEAYIELSIGDTNASKSIHFKDLMVLTNDQVTTPHAQYLLKTDNVDQIDLDISTRSNLGNLNRIVRHVGASSPTMVVRHQETSAYRIQNDGGGTLDPLDLRSGSGILSITRQTSGNPAFRAFLIGDTQPRAQWLVGGQIQMGGGSATPDVQLSRIAANVMGLAADDCFLTGKDTTANRPSASTVGAGAQFFDTTLNQPIWSTGSVWVDAHGYPVDNDWLVADMIATGEESIPRALVGSTTLSMTSQVLRLCFFTARKTETITQVTIDTGGTLAGATPSLIRIGVWTTDSTGALLSQVAATPNDTTLLAGTFTTYTKSFSSSLAKVAGQRYAVGALVVTAAAAPGILGMNTNLNNGHINRAPRLAAQITAQADLPSTAAAGALSNSNNRPYFVLLP